MKLLLYVVCLIAVGVGLGVALFLETPARLNADEPQPPVARSKPSDSSQPAGTSKTVKKDKKMVQVSVFNNEGKLVGPIDSPKLKLSDAEWKKRLTPEQYKVVRAKGTERAFCGTLLDNKLEGVYTCVGCGLPLFSSSSKFHSGTGWPSFFQPIAKGNVAEHRDLSHHMVRVEITCARCDGHLGHVFDDGPQPTGLRFCLNSESLTFTPDDKLASLADPSAEGQDDKSSKAEPVTDKASKVAPRD